MERTDNTINIRLQETNPTEAAAQGLWPPSPLSSRRTPSHRCRQKVTRLSKTVLTTKASAVTVKPLTEASMANLRSILPTSDPTQNMIEDRKILEPICPAAMLQEMKAMLDILGY